MLSSAPPLRRHLTASTITLSMCGGNVNGAAGTGLWCAALATPDAMQRSLRYHAGHSRPPSLVMTPLRAAAVDVDGEKQNAMRSNSLRFSLVCVCATLLCSKSTNNTNHATLAIPSQCSTSNKQLAQFAAELSLLFRTNSSNNDSFTRQV